MLLLSPVIVNLRNTATGRYHPCVFREAPLPGGAGPRRWKSKMHHTDGFAIQEEAIAEFSEIAKRLGGDVRCDMAMRIEWDGNDIPASVEFFDYDALERVETTL